MDLAGGAATESATHPEPQPEAGTEAENEAGAWAGDRNLSRRPSEPEFDRVLRLEQESFSFNFNFMLLLLIFSNPGNLNIIVTRVTASATSRGTTLTCPTLSAGGN